MKRWLVLLTLGALAGCTPAADSGHPEAHAAAAGGLHQVHVEPGMRERWGIVTAEVTLTDRTAEAVLPGVVALDLDRTVQITPLLSGQIASIHVDLGDHLAAGDSVLTLKSPEFTRAQSEFLDLMARATLARREFDRAQALLPQQAIEEREYQRRQAEYESLVTALGAAESLLHAYGLDHDRVDALRLLCADVLTGGRDCEVADPRLPLTTPLAGTVIQRDAILGENVGPDRVLFTISDLSRLWVNLDAYEYQLAALRVGAEVALLSDFHPDRPLTGRIAWISDSVDEHLRTVRVRVTVRDPDRLLKPNLFVQGLVLGTSDHPQTAVPDEAVQYLEGAPVVFVLSPPEPGENHEVFIARPVRPGASVGGLRIILEGLQAGETVVVRGAFTLKTELIKGSVGHEHVH
jgi:cobalt-zinc-cadmium efflux system membrane fusion protein